MSSKNYWRLYKALKHWNTHHLGGVEATSLKYRKVVDDDCAELALSIFKHFGKTILSELSGQKRADGSVSNLKMFQHRIDEFVLV